MKPGVATVVCRGGEESVTHPVQEIRVWYLLIINSTKQTLQSTQTIITATQQTNFLIRVEFPGCYNTTPPTRDLVPRSRTIRGRGGEKRESTIFNTTNKGLCSMSTSNFCRDKFPQRDGDVGKMKPSGAKKKNDSSKRRSREAFSLNREDTRQED